MPTTPAYQHKTSSSETKLIKTEQHHRINITAGVLAKKKPAEVSNRNPP
jgi:hypothetical protein